MGLLYRPYEYICINGLWLVLVRARKALHVLLMTRRHIYFCPRSRIYFFTIYMNSLCQRCALLNPTTKFEKVVEIKTAVSWLNTLRPRQNCRHFADVIFRSICFNETVQMSLNISLRFVPKVRFNNTPAVVQVMAWGWAGTKQLSEPVMVS